jgi:hypothetical protein
MLAPAPLSCLGLAGPSVPKIPQKFHQIAQNKQEKIVKKNIFWKNLPPPLPTRCDEIFGSKFLFRQGKALILWSGNAV